MNRLFKRYIVLASIIALITCAPIKAEWSWKQLFNIFKNSAQSQRVPIVSSPNISKVTRPNLADTRFEQFKSAPINNQATFNTVDRLPKSYFGPLSRKLISKQNKPTQNNQDRLEREDDLEKQANAKKEFEETLEKKQEKEQFHGLYNGFTIAEKYALSSIQARYEAVLKTLRENKLEKVTMYYPEFGIKIDATQDLNITASHYCDDTYSPESPTTLSKTIEFLKNTKQFIDFAKKQIPPSDNQAPVSTTKSVTADTINNALNEIISKLLDGSLTSRNIDTELQQYKIGGSLTKNNRRLCKKRRELLYLAIDKNWAQLLDQNNQNKLQTKGSNFDGIVQIGVIKCLIAFGLSIDEKDITYANKQRQPFIADSLKNKFLQNNKK